MQYEREFIKAALTGDINAEKALYDAHVDRVYGLTYRMCGDVGLAEDFTQETFLRAFKHLPGFRGQAAFSTWLHSITMSVTLNGLRKVKRYRHWETSNDDPPVGTVDPDWDLRRRLRRAMDELPDKLRAVFVLYEVEGYKHQEIASVLDITEGTSKARLSRAKDKLRGALGDSIGKLAGKEGS
ncbi:MAG: RNA polymerase sigma factor [bacterium]|nr:RNA polymerase sigma factor [bacterium]